MSKTNKYITIDEIDALRKELLASKKLFVDDSFVLKAPANKVKWLRPHQICSNPQFIVEGISRFDVNQGTLGNCWFMAAIDNLTQHQQLFKRVVCDTNNNFTGQLYCGLFHFKFWHFGKWVDIIVDDQLPTNDGKLIFVNSNTTNEFWPSLLEKAYAKLYGGYENLKGGQITEAFSDLTGGVTETYDLKDPPKDFFNMMLKAFRRNTLMGCAKFKKTDSYLPSGHAYSISDVNRIMDKHCNVVEMVRIRNPWGNDCEFKGDWSDYSPKWVNVTEQEKQRIGLNAKGDGEFWMSYKDFLYHFDYLEICNLTPDLLTREPHSGREWKVTTHQEVWRKENKVKHEFLAVDPDPDDSEDYCTIVVAVMYVSKDRSDKKRLGLKIQSPNDKTFYKTTKPDKYARRESVFRFDLLPGTYHFEIHSFDTQYIFEYLFRIFYETKKVNTIYPSLCETTPIKNSKKMKKSNAKKCKHRVKYYTQHKKGGKKSCIIM